MICICMATSGGINTDVWNVCKYTSLKLECWYMDDCIVFGDNTVVQSKNLEDDYIHTSMHGHFGSHAVAILATSVNLENCEKQWLSLIREPGSS
jgi:hypothetical protein